MSGSESTGRIELSAALSGVEFTVVDGNFQQVATGMGTLVADLPQGIYEVSVRAGGQVETNLVSLQAGETWARQDVSMDVFSSAPLTRGAEPDQQARLVAAASESISGADAADAGVVLVVRTADPDSGTPLRYGQLSLLDRRLEPVPDAEWTVHASAGVATMALRVEPGPYVLRFSGADGPALDQSIWLPAHWQTLHFAPNGTGEALALDDASVHLTPVQTPFRPGDYQAGAALEIAMSGLRQGRPLVSSDLVELMAGNPMLGIVGAHALLLAAQPDLDLYRRVVRRLRLSIPDHPDVVALAAHPSIGGLAELPSVWWPPMLAASYELLLAADRIDEHVIKDGSTAERVAGYVVRRGPWLGWEAAPAVLAVPSPKPPEPSRRVRPSKPPPDPDQTGEWSQPTTEWRPGGPPPSDGPGGPPIGLPEPTPKPTPPPRPKPIPSPVSATTAGATRRVQRHVMEVAQLTGGTPHQVAGWLGVDELARRLELPVQTVRTVLKELGWSSVLVAVPPLPQAFAAAPAVPSVAVGPAAAQPVAAREDPFRDRAAARDPSIRPPDKRRWWWLALLLALVVAATVLAIALVNRDSADPGGDPTHTVETFRADFKLTIHGTTTARVGRRITPYLRIRNAGPSPARGTLTVTVPQQFELTRPISGCTGDRQLTCRIGISAGGQIRVDVPLIARRSGTGPLVATVTSQIEETHPADNAASVPLTAGRRTPTTNPTVTPSSSPTPTPTPTDVTPTESPPRPTTPGTPPT